MIESTLNQLLIVVVDIFHDQREPLLGNNLKYTFEINEMLIKTIIFREINCNELCKFLV